MLFRFELNSSVPLELQDHSVQDAVAVSTGRCHAVFIWWDLEMDTRGQCILSCAPKWARPQSDSKQVSECGCI